MPWKLIIQSNFKRTAFEPKSLYNLQYDPHEDSNLLKSSRVQEIADGLFKDYMDIVKSGRPTAPRRSLVEAR